jgi:hypothetical protein
LSDSGPSNAGPDSDAAVGLQDAAEDETIVHDGSIPHDGASKDARTDSTPSDEEGSDSMNIAADTSPPPQAPRPIAPLSTSRVTSQKPTLRWELSSGVPDVTVDLCLDRACTRPIGDSVHVTGTSYAPTSPLTAGVVYWRLHPGRVTSVTSPTWQFTVGHRSAAVDSSWGTRST